jgi:hypothetical protein
MKHASKPRKRAIRAFSHERADGLIGQIEQGMELFALNKGASIYWHLNKVAILQNLKEVIKH